ncbi:MAG TPA: aldose 1-epimerase family protein [Segetibacter sp.]|jgi:galactose mutarotase-like enzyme
MYSISSNVIKVDISSKGAELQSIHHIQNQMEYLWQAGPEWPKKSPVLFPIIGELKDKKYSYNGKEYNLSRHGFARETEFSVKEQTNNSITFTTQSNEQTLLVYPFDFVFSVKYTATDNILTVTYIVENTGNDVMYFSVGGHPAFKVPIAEGTIYEDYELVFDEPETTGRWPLTPEGLVKDTPTPLLQNETTLPLKKDLFTADAIVFKQLKSTSVSIKSAKTEHGLTVSFPDFPYLGIWETKGGDYVCIEPWCGIADNANVSGKLEEKEGINTLEAQATFKAAFTVKFF